MIINNGTIAGAADGAFAAGIRIEDISVSGVIVNNGTVSGLVNAIDASIANGVNIVNSGLLEGNVILSSADDLLILEDGSEFTGLLDGGAGDNDILVFNDGTTAAEAQALIDSGTVSNFEIILFDDGSFFDADAFQNSNTALGEDIDAAIAASIAENSAVLFDGLAETLNGLIDDAFLSSPLITGTDGFV